MSSTNRRSLQTDGDGLPDLPSIVSQKQKLSDYIYDVMVEYIVKGRLSPGQRLREAEVADKLDVSRTPVREAFTRMEMQHLLERDPTGAYLVATWDRQALHEIATLRGALEGMAVGLACQRMQAADYDFLQSLIMQMKAATLRKDYDTLIDLDIEFHSYIWSCTGHNLLCETLESMKSQVRFFMYLTRPGDEETYGETHQELLDVLREEDPYRARQAVKEHTLVTAERAIARLETEGQLT
jgi:DNA-binding GntR family transcriptional regulator